MFDYMTSLRQVVAELRISPHRFADPLTRNVTFHKNSLLQQGSKMSGLNI
jgi:hypothetical protein